MRNHYEKRRDMCRSILPSTGRAWARDAANTVRRKHRRGIRQDLHLVAQFEDPDVFEVDLRRDTNRVDGGYYGSIRVVVLERREADKVGPLMRWARETLKTLPGTDIDRYMWFKAILPDNTIGRHALSHLRPLFVLPGDEYRGYWWLARRAEYWAALAQGREARLVAFTGLVRTVVEDRLGDLNDALKAHGYFPCYGLHDVDRFAASIINEPGRRVVLFSVAMLPDQERR